MSNSSSSIIVIDLDDDTNVDEDSDAGGLWKLTTVDDNLVKVFYG